MRINVNKIKKVQSSRKKESTIIGLRCGRWPTCSSPMQTTEDHFRPTRFPSQCNRWPVRSYKKLTISIHCNRPESLYVIATVFWCRWQGNSWGKKKTISSYVTRTKPSVNIIGYLVIAWIKVTTEKRETTQIFQMSDTTCVCVWYVLVIFPDGYNKAV